MRYAKVMIFIPIFSDLCLLFMRIIVVLLHSSKFAPALILPLIGHSTIFEFPYTSSWRWVDLIPKILSDQIWVASHTGQPLTYPYFTIFSSDFSKEMPTMPTVLSYKGSFDLYKREL